MRKKTIPQRFFKTSLPKTDIMNWLSDVNRFFYQKSIYQLTWKEFHYLLRLKDKKCISKQLGYSSQKQLQVTFARIDHGFKHCSLDEFKNMSKKHLQICLGEKMNQKIRLNKNFQLKVHKLCAIHYFLYDKNIHSAAINLGFSSKQCFLNFFAQSNYVMDFTVAEIKKSLKCLQKLSPKKFAEELGELYYHVVIKVSHFFQRYNYSLEELKSLLITEDQDLVIASLGGSSSRDVNRKLKKLVDLGINLSLQRLTSEPLANLQENTYKEFWKIKLYRLFEWIQAKKTQDSFSSMQSKEITLKKESQVYQVDSKTLQPEMVFA